MQHKITKQITLTSEYAGQRLDQALAQLLPEFSRSKLTQWLKSGDILCNGQSAKAKDKVYGEELITLNVELSDETHWQAENLPLDICYEDDDLLVINKPAELVVHPGAGNASGTLVNAVLNHYPQASALPRAGLIHRLDKDTTGLLVIAKSLTAQTKLTKALQQREIHREYLCLVNGTLTGGGTVDEPLGRHPRNRLKQAVIVTGRPAVTHYRINESFPHYTLLQVILETGRTHQIRVHMANIHHAVVGDPLYNRLQLPKHCDETLKQTLRQFKRQALHASKLSFIHPTTAVPLTFSAPLPKDFSHLLEVIRTHDQTEDNYT